MSNTLRIYGCGGCGVNLTAPYFDKKQESGTAKLAPALIDTSRSNLHGRKVPDDATFLFDALDGSGKIRRENYEEINKSIRKILVDIPPAEFNLVVFSAAGGSGSVIGPLMISEMNKRNIPCMAIVIGADESAIAADNTLKTIKSLEGVSKATSTPVIMSYHSNKIDGKRSETDESVRNAISCLSVLTSGLNVELDHLDLVNWLNYVKVNGGTPQLATMNIAFDSEQAAAVGFPISMASLYNNPDDTKISTRADYMTVGYADLTGAKVDQIHYIIGTDQLAEIGRALKSTVAEIDEQRQARVEQDSLLDAGDRTEDTGVCL